MASQPPIMSALGAKADVRINEADSQLTTLMCVVRGDYRFPQKQTEFALLRYAGNWGWRRTSDFWARWVQTVNFVIVKSHSFKKAGALTTRWKAPQAQGWRIRRSSIRHLQHSLRQSQSLLRPNPGTLQPQRSQSACLRGPEALRGRPSLQNH